MSGAADRNTGGKIQETMQAFEAAKTNLKDLYDHWEESVELNG